MHESLHHYAGLMFNQPCEPTLGDLEDQTPVYDSDLEQEREAILAELEDCKFMRRMIKIREAELRFALAKLTTPVQEPESKVFNNPVHLVVFNGREHLVANEEVLLRQAASHPHVSVPAIVEKQFNGTTQPISPDATLDDNL